MCNMKKASHLFLFVFLACLTASSSLADHSKLLVLRGNITELSELNIPWVQSEHGHHVFDSKYLPAINQFKEQGHDHFIIRPYSAFKPITKNQTKGSVNPNIQGLLNQLDIGRWYNDVVTLSSWSRRTATTGNVSAANWLANQFSQMGYAVSQPSFTVQGQPTNNIMAEKVGTVRPDDWYLVGAHMDSISNTSQAPGAVDNASGCAAVVEMAKVVKDIEFEASLLFICFSGEEQGLHGSAFHVSTLSNNQTLSQLKAALTMDMIGYSSDNDRELLIESSQAHTQLMNLIASMAATYAPGLTTFTSTNYWGSDHVPYIDAGVPAVLLIDDDYGVYPGYHRSTDQPENISQDQAMKIIKTNLATLASLAGAVFTDDLIFVDSFE